MIRGQVDGQETSGCLVAAKHDQAHTRLTQAFTDRRVTKIYLAAVNGIREVYTWTQTGNEAMQQLNRSLGYVDRNMVVNVRAALPLAG